jgi:hypothetical protein
MYLIQFCYIRDVGDVLNEFGILFENCDNSVITINDNFLTFSNSYQTGTGIWVPDATGSNTVWIARDTITNRTRGIKTENCKSALIEENVILEVPTGLSINSWGIIDVGGDKNTTLGNFLETPTFSGNTSRWPIGIYLDLNTIGELVQCNDIARLNRLIEIEADWSHTEFLYGNRMTDGRRGLSIISSVGPLLTAGNIGVQGNSSSGGFTSDNRWGGTFTQACIRIDDCGNAGMIDFIVRSSGLPFDASSCIGLNAYASSYSPPTFSVISGLDTMDCSQYYSR